MARRMTSPVLVGRTEMVGRIRAALDATLSGQPRHVIVGGEAGVGKTRLLAETAGLAEAAGARVLVGACVSMGDEGLPFSPYAEIVRSLVASDGAAQVAAAAGRAAADLARLVPALGQGRSEPGQEPWAQTRLYEALLDVFHRWAARGPLVLQLEDLHWADSGTLAATSFLLRAIQDEPIAIVATFRSDDVHRRHPLRPWLAEVSRDVAVDRIDLQPLREDEIASLVHHILGEDLSQAELADIARRSDGNPFFIEELLASRGDGGGALPGELRDVLLARVDALPESAGQTLAVAAVGGREVEHVVLVEVMGDGSELLEADLRGLVEGGLLVPARAADDDDAYTFRHALLREAVYEAMLPTERRRLHHRWADILAAHWQDAGTSAPADALQLAHHWRQARDERALAASIRAGDAAMGGLSFATALREYEEALQLWGERGAREVGIDHVELLERTARAAYLASHERSALAACREALEELGDVDPVRRTRLLTLLARVLWVSGEWGASMAAYEEAVARAPEAPPVVRLQAIAGLAQVYMLHARFREARPLCEAVIEGARAIGVRELEGHGLNTLSVVLAGLGISEAAFEAIDAALDIALALCIPDDIGRAYVNKGDVQAWCGYPEDAFETSLEGVRVAAEWGVANSYGSYIGFGAVAFGFESGRWDQARDVLARADRMCGSPEGTFIYRASYILEFLACSGDDAVESLWERARRLVLERPAGDNLALIYLGGIAQAAFAGRRREAYELAREAIDLLSATDADVRVVDLARAAAWPLAELGRTARRAGDTEELAEARSAMARLVALAHERPAEMPQPGGRLGEVLAASARQVETEQARMEGTDDGVAWERVADDWLGLGRPFRAAMARWRAAEAWETAGDRERAAAGWRQARDIAAELGARPLLAQLEVMARRLRLRPGPSGETRGTATRPYGLTRREAEVLIEVAAGATNREIAERLFISESTAGVHVSNILTKLGVSTRTEAARVALDQGLAGGAE